MARKKTAKKKAKGASKAKAKVTAATKDEGVAKWLRGVSKTALAGSVAELRKQFHEEGRKRSFARFLELLAVERKRRGVKAASKAK